LQILRTDDKRVDENAVGSFLRVTRFGPYMQQCGR